MRGILNRRAARAILIAASNEWHPKRNQRRIANGILDDLEKKFTVHLRAIAAAGLPGKKTTK